MIILIIVVIFIVVDCFIILHHINLHVLPMSCSQYTDINTMSDSINVWNFKKDMDKHVEAPSKRKL